MSSKTLFIMKGIVHLKCLFVCLGLSILLFNNECLARGSGKISPLILKAGKGKKVSLVIEEARKVNSIEFRDAIGDTKIYKKVVEIKGPFVQLFNLGSWPEGTYDIVVLTTEKKVIQPLELTHSDLVILKDQRQEFLAPIVVSPQTKSIDVFMESKGSDIEVAIMNESGAVIFKRIYRKESRLKRRFDLRNLKKSMYLVKVSTPKKAFYRHIRI